MENLCDKQYSIEDILKKCEYFGIPHFQRGSVWNDDSISLLLESLYYDTPIGSIVLWSCDNKEQGESWVKPNSEFKYLIVDGQQRLRSLYSVYCENKDNDTDRRIWCLNLKKVKGFELLNDGTAREYSLFENVLEKFLISEDRDPETRASTFSKYFIPIKWLDRYEEYTDKIRMLLDGKNEIMERLENVSSKKINKMTKGKLFVKVLSENLSFVEVIQLYNRINSGGKRVEAEEMAYATLVSIWPETSNKIAEIFNKIHTVSDSKKNSNDRNDVLKRMKERNFGFKMFIKTFIQVCNYHFGFSPGASGFSFAIMESMEFQKKLSDNAGKMQELWEITENILVFFNKILKDKLFCDSYQFLPETSSLLPIFQVLIRYQSIMDDDKMNQYIDKLAAITLQLLLSPRTNRDILSLVNLVNKANTLEEVLNDLCRESKKYDLASLLKTANTLQDRTTLLLYWLLRSQHAKDFSYKANVNILKKPEYFTNIIDEDRALSFKQNPEKQHIIPYSKLKVMFNITDKARLSTHIANNIGNITYISQDLNSFTYGIGDKALELELELDSGKDNIKNHLLSDPSGRILSYYKKIVKTNDKELKNIEGKYENGFIVERQKLIAEAFQQWINRLFDSHCDESQRIEPARRKFVNCAYFTIQEKIREFGFVDNVEDSLILVSNDFKETNKSKNNKDIDMLEITSDKYVLRLNNKNEINTSKISLKIKTEQERNKIMGCLKENGQEKLALKINEAKDYIELSNEDVVNIFSKT